MGRRVVITLENTSLFGVQVSSSSKSPHSNSVFSRRPPVFRSRDVPSVLPSVLVLAPLAPLLGLCRLILDTCSFVHYLSSRHCNLVILCTRCNHVIAFVSSFFRFCLCFFRTRYVLQNMETSSECSRCQTSGHATYNGRIP